MGYGSVMIYDMKLYAIQNLLMKRAALGYSHFEMRSLCIYLSSCLYSVDDFDVERYGTEKKLTRLDPFKRCLSPNRILVSSEITKPQATLDDCPPVFDRTMPHCLTLRLNRNEPLPGENGRYDSM